MEPSPQSGTNLVINVILPALRNGASGKFQSIGTTRKIPTIGASALVLPLFGFPFAIGYPLLSKHRAPSAR
jgi:hypothetical protein